MTLHPRVLTGIRIFVGLVFTVYGVVKIFGGQFYYGDWTMSKATVEGPGLVWAFYGFSPYYGRFIGFAELLPALMLFMPRTATIGAALLFPVALNITAMDFFYGFPSVKWMALLYTALLGVLLWTDRAKLLMLLEPTAKIEQYRGMAHMLSNPAPRAPMSSRTRGLVYGVLGVFVLFLANLIGTALVSGPEAEAAARARDVPGVTDSVQMVRSRYSGLLGVNRKAVVVLAAGGDTVHAFAHRASGFTPWRIDSIVPQARKAPRPVVIYLHGRIIEEQGPMAVSPAWGAYDWQAIVDSLRASDFTVIADLRPRGTDSDAWAARVVSQVDSVIGSGVPSSHVAVVGFSKGAGIAVRTSAKLRRTDLTFVFMGACPPGQPYASVVAGRILSIYEASDSVGQSCRALLDAAQQGSRTDERRIETGKLHGAFFQPRAEWIAPVRAWVRDAAR